MRQQVTSPAMAGRRADRDLRRMFDRVVQRLVALPGDRGLEGVVKSWRLGVRMSTPWFYTGFMWMAS
jgi:hypothetical protein